MTDLPAALGVVGAGTMGAGIAQLGCLAGMPTFLHDPVPAALAGGAEKVRAGLEKGAERGRWSAEEAAAAAARLEPKGLLEELAGCELVIEAAPERLDLKRELFERLSATCGEDTVLATNTSSIPVVEIAGAAARPENVAGMHFFNPAPLMRLVEVIAAPQTGERAIALARVTGEAMGKRVILAQDGPGFLVNRCGRPFYTEALRLLQERIATHDQIDRICRLGAGFRMGPFELMDLVGIDVGYAVARSFTELSFGEPRWRPNPIQARMAAAGRLGRKTGRGYYDYSAEPYRPDDPPAPEPGGGGARAVAISGDGPVAEGLRMRAREAGFEVAEGATGPEVSIGGLVGGADPEAVLCADRSLAAAGIPGAAGFYLLPPEGGGSLVELARTNETSDEAARAVEAFFTCLGYHREWVGDAPGLVLGRIVCGLVNEAAFAIGERVGSPADVDAGLELGLNHPRGPVAWSELLGVAAVAATIDGLHDHYREERYRLAPLLRSAALTGASLRD